MMPPDDTVRGLAHALDAFLAEHRGCWRLYGEGLERGEDDTRCWLECAGCGSVMIVSRR
jgi:hypothetical protein